MQTSELQPLTSNQETLNSTLVKSSICPSINFQSNQQGVYDQLNQLFNEHDKQQKEILEAREILGDSAKDLTDSQVFDLVNEVQYLVDSWLEEYERKVFDGKTLDELLNLVS
ncbi:MAG: hypothetical protein M1365_04300 [Actinobacteria bacterium]|nr:hypothetical protein [Actinomycetota bacterium]